MQHREIWSQATIFGSIGKKVNGINIGDIFANIFSSSSEVRNLGWYFILLFHWKFILSRFGSIGFLNDQRVRFKLWRLQRVDKTRRRQYNAHEQLQRCCSNVAVVRVAEQTASQLVLVDVESKVDLGHISGHWHAAAAKSCQEHLRLWYVGVAIGPRLRSQISVQTSAAV